MTDTDPTGADLAPVPDIAHTLGVREIDVREAVRRGELPYVRLHGALLLPLSAVRRALAARVVPPSTSPTPTARPAQEAADGPR